MLRENPSLVFAKGREGGDAGWCVLLRLKVPMSAATSVVDSNSATVCTLSVPVPNLVKGGGRH